MEDEEHFGLKRDRMVREHLRERGIRDPRVLDVMATIPRHVFVNPEHRGFAYADGPLPIGCGQTISQPYMVALMTELLELKGPEKVLEVGTGSGYQAAILAALAREVYTIERHGSLAHLAGRILRDLGFENVKVIVGDGSEGLPGQAPFDAIIVTAGAPEVPPALLAQLADHGRLVVPVGGRGEQYLERWERRGPDDYISESILPVAFVPLVGRQGWPV